MPSGDMAHTLANHGIAWDMYPGFGHPRMASESICDWDLTHLIQHHGLSTLDYTIDAHVNTTPCPPIHDTNSTYYINTSGHLNVLRRLATPNTSSTAPLVPSDILINDANI